MHSCPSRHEQSVCESCFHHNHGEQLNFSLNLRNIQGKVTEGQGISIWLLEALDNSSLGCYRCIQTPSRDLTTCFENHVRTAKIELKQKLESKTSKTKSGKKFYKCGTQGPMNNSNDIETPSIVRNCLLLEI